MGEFGIAISKHRLKSVEEFSGQHFDYIITVCDKTIERALDYLVATRSLERIRDHARNIAENVIYVVQGIDVRHQPAA